MFIISFGVSIIVSTTMYLIQRKWSMFRSIFDIIALLCLLVFSSIAASAIYEVLINHTVFMTNIHALFLNGFFLVSGAYVLMYSMYKLIHMIVRPA
ncbi:transposase [Alkalicoccobacillus gibsonii]|jgi:Na+/H+-dicarboxylate symporter|uniref:transposase n=1 Tax=Alkalicoccobacillus gibsonii TaxID=79881 RepID=UPI0019326018|nr:transposase [Alkalicoccobacillus gibsonii]MBM0064898.1 transposase [Alkalicoccobacillus gibsonii]